MASNITTASSSANTFEIQDEEANAAFLLGKRDVLLNNYQSACDHLSKACERIVKLRDNDTAPELAEPYFYYGQALLYLGLSEQQVFGSDIVKDNDNDENDNENENENENENNEAEDPQGAQVEQEKTDGTTESKDKDENGQTEGENEADETIPDDEQVNDLERAFEILQCAHMIYSKVLENQSDNAHIVTRLGDIHVMLADICNENGDHENALSHVMKAIELQETINEQQRYRLLAESYYKLGLIHELINKFSDAVESFEKAIGAIRQAIEKCEGDDKQTEREELQSLLPSMELKRNDAKASLADRHLIAQARKIVAGHNSTNQINHTTTENGSSDSTVVKDITLNIRHKRPVTELEPIDEENKKVKTDDS